MLTRLSVTKVALAVASATVGCLLITGCGNPDSRDDAVSEDALNNVQQVSSETRRECTYYVQDWPIWQIGSTNSEPTICTIRRQQVVAADDPARQLTEETITLPGVAGAFRIQGPIDSFQPERWVMTWSSNKGSIYETIIRDGDCLILTPDRNAKLCFGSAPSVSTGAAASEASAAVAPSAPAANAGSEESADPAAVIPVAFQGTWASKRDLCAGGKGGTGEIITIRARVIETGGGQGVPVTVEQPSPLDISSSTTFTDGLTGDQWTEVVRMQMSDDRRTLTHLVDGELLTLVRC